MLQESLSVVPFLALFDSIPYDRESIPQQRLDLASRFRTSLFPWRGQFSPELIELFLEKYADRSSHATVVLDPFAGSGTTLFECARQGLTCYASEINPAAVVMASTAHFVNVPLLDRKHIIRAAESIAMAHVEPLRYDLFTCHKDTMSIFPQLGTLIEETFGPMVQQAMTDPLVYNLIANAIIRYVSHPREHAVDDFLRALRGHAAIVQALPYSTRPCRLFHCDARGIPLPDASVDLVITSPPYINVFNYHQNSRQAMETLGWNLLRVARSEIGSNRKNRQNRFLTVVQYAVDMLDALREIRRLLCPNGRAIIVVGRESNVRGVSFKNGRLVAALATAGAALDLAGKQERRFKNKFGEVIYEDILQLVPKAAGTTEPEGYARSVAELVLSEAALAAETSVRTEVLDAIERVGLVEKSPLFQPRESSMVPAVEGSKRTL